MTKGLHIAAAMLVSFAMWCALFLGVFVVLGTYGTRMRALGNAGLVSILLLLSGLTLLAVGFAMNWAARQWLGEITARASRYVVAGGAALLLAGAGATVAGVV